MFFNHIFGFRCFAQPADVVSDGCQCCPMSQVTITDNGGLSATTQLTIFVINVDEPPYYIENSPILRTIREMPEVAVGDLALALVNSALLPTSINVKDPEPGAVTITIADGKQRAAFNLTTPVYVAGIRTTQVMLSVANTSVLDYETLYLDYAIRLVLTAVDLGGHYVNSSLVTPSSGCVHVKTFALHETVFGLDTPCLLLRCTRFVCLAPLAGAVCDRR